MKLIYKLTITLTLALLIMSCNDDKMPTEKEADSVSESTYLSISKKQFEASQMVEGRIEKRSFESRLNVNGKISIPNKSKAIVSSMMEGTLGALGQSQGEWVKRGKPLLQITNPTLIDLQEQYLVLQSEGNFLREERIRKQELVKENLIGKQDFLSVQSKYEGNRAMLNAVRKKLQLYGLDVDKISSDNLSSSISIKAPISGYITHINASMGQFVDPKDEIMTIENKSGLFLALNVLEQDGALIQKGQEISYALSSNPSKMYNSTISLILPSINKEGMLTVQCKIEEKEGVLPGMYATASLTINANDGYAIPETALVQIKGKPHVLVQVSKTGEVYNYMPKPLEIGHIQNGYVEIINGKELVGESLLLKGGYYVVE